MSNLLFKPFNRFAGFDGGGAGKAAHTARIGVGFLKKRVGSAEGLLFHAVDFKPFVSV